MKRLLLLFILAATAVFGAQSITPSGTYTLGVTLPNAPWTYFSETQPMRWEFRIHNFGADWQGGSVVRFGPIALYSIGPNLAFMQPRTIDTFTSGDAFTMPGCCEGRTDVLVRVQRDVVNSQYTWELWNTSGGGYLLETEAVSSFGSESWAGLIIWVSSGRTAFLRWFSSTVPLGSSVPIAGVTGDLGDWEFEGNENDSSGHGLNMNDSGATYSTTPVYPPSCNVGNPTSFRAGYSAQLNGTASSPLDGGVALTYLWQQLAGPTVTWSRQVRPGRPNVSSQTEPQPTITGLVAGSYTFQLTVKDGSGQSSVCTVDDGAVVTDDHDVVITNLPEVDTLLGPMIRYGANPWPWFDVIHKAEADMQIANMDVYYGDYWDVADPGTVTVTYNSTAVTGVGTTFTTTFCNGPESPTVPKAAMIIWYPTSTPGETGRRQMSVSSCQSDTSLTMVNTWTNDVSDGSGMSYSDNSASGIWSYNAAPANYYDNVAAFYALYYRSGIVDYLNAARKLADRFWTCPQMDRGSTYWVNAYGDANEAVFPHRSRSILGLVLRALDGRPDIWTGLNVMYGYYNNFALNYDAQFVPAVWDAREEAYELAEMAYCALYDTNATQQSTCQALISSALTRVWTPARFPDGGWYQFFATGGSWVSPTSSVYLTNGSTAVVGTGTSWTSADNGALAWFINSTAGPTSNSQGDAVTYTVTYVNGTHLTLSSPYEGTTGTHGWVLEDTTGSPVIGFGQLPYMMGLLSFAFDLASQAIANTDPTGSATYRGYNVDTANWVKTYGYRAATKGMYYLAQFVNCQAPISESNVACTSGYSADQSRELGFETIRGIAAAYKYNKDASLEAFADTIFNAEWAKPATCPSGSTICVPDGTYVLDYDTGQSFMIGTPPIGEAPKWFGQGFGVSALSAWAADRIGGPELQPGPPGYVGFNLAGVPNAASARIAITTPDGQTSYTGCGPSPCFIGGDSGEGAGQIRLEFLSSTGKVVASSELPIIPVP
jgi:hypothetical protein